MKGIFNDIFKLISLDVSEMHSNVFLLETFLTTVKNSSSTTPREIHSVLLELCTLFSLNIIQTRFAYIFYI
jgi:hypothetical protein